MNTNNDINFLKLLSIFHYIMGGAIAFLALISAIYLIRGILFIVSPESFPIESIMILITPGHKLSEYIFTFINGIYFILGVIFAIAVIRSGRFLRLHKKYWFSFVIACLLCCIVPFGTVLGILTLIVLSRKSVKELYFPSK